MQTRSIGAAIAAVIALLVAAFAADNADAAEPDLIANNGKDWVRLHDRPCKDKEILALIPEPMRGDFRAASVSFGGQKYTACWVAAPQGVLLQYGDADRGILPFSAFAPVKGV